MSSGKQPAGGFDSTQLHPSRQPTYTCKITFHRAYNLPVADFGRRSADPFVLAHLKTSLPTRHPQDPPIRFRSKTVWRSLAPEWNAAWVVAGVPQSGMTLKVRLYDEDPEDHDDRLGSIEVDTGRLDENWKGIKEADYKVHRHGASFRAYTLQWCSKVTHKGKKLHAQMVISIEMLGRTKEELGKVYTINNFWWIHYSPMIGRLAGVKSSEGGAEKFNFQANQIQLQGPVPNELYHRYVDFKKFVGGMFTGTGARGRVLHTTLHHQHERIYNFTKTTKAGDFPDGPGREMTLQFLDMVHYDTGGRIFTYVITLDGLFRFTETGKEFGIDLLSKHTMHSDVNIYIAWSGEFLVRRLAHPDRRAEDPGQRTHPADDLPGGPPNRAPPKDPKHYELIIDNDSGTYRPNADLIPVFKEFLDRNFPGLHIVVKSCTDKDLDKIKEDQKKTKGKEGEEMVFDQNSRSSSISSSDEEDLAERARSGGPGHTSKVEGGVAFLEKPREGIQGLIPGEKGKHEREDHEARDDEAAGATPA